MARPQYTPEQRYFAFWNKVVITADDNKCWEFQGCKSKLGYGKIGINNHGKTINIPAHQFAWQYPNYIIPKGMEICHSCDNPSCCNPKHLFLATHFENMQDRDNKGRKNQKRGIENGAPKLTDDKVRYIRQRYAQDDISIPKLANEMHIGKTTVWNILHYRKWKHVH